MLPHFGRAEVAVAQWAFGSEVKVALWAWGTLRDFEVITLRYNGVFVVPLHFQDIYFSHFLKGKEYIILKLKYHLHIFKCNVFLFQQLKGSLINRNIKSIG